MKRKYLFVAGLVVLVLLAVAIQPLLAQSGNSWYIQYFNNSDWAGAPAMTTYAAYVDFNWNGNPPGPGMPSENWTGIMSTSAYFYSGNYVFNGLADDEMSLQIDGVTYINTLGQGMSGKTVTVVVPLAQGYHNILVYYRQYTGNSYCYLNWTISSGPYPPVPPPAPVQPIAPTPTPGASCNPSWQCTCPTQATSVQTKYGDYTPCIQNNQHQSACFQSDGQWDSPNMGSIETEPKIQVWGACTPGAKQSMQLSCNQAPVTATCSKTGAGWFFYSQ